MLKRKKVGLALGGGGARGFAHLGILMVLEENHIPIDIITGTSMGAVIGAVKALGLDLHKLYTVIGLLDLNEILGVSESTTREIQRAIGRGVVEYVRGEDLKQETTPPERLARMYKLFSLFTANKDFSALTIPFAAVAADLLTGERVILRDGPIYRAVAASAAVPGVFHPVHHQGRFLIDGGVIDKIPIDAALELGAQVVIAIDASSPLAGHVRTSLDVMFQAQRITSQALTSLQIKRAIELLPDRFLYLHPQVDTITMLAFSKFQQAVTAGREAAETHMDEIRRLCGVRAPRSTKKSRGERSLPGTN